MTEVLVGVVVDRLVGVEVEEVGVNSEVEGEVDLIIEAVVDLPAVVEVLVVR